MRPPCRPAGVVRLPLGDADGAACVASVRPTRQPCGHPWEGDCRMSYSSNGSSAATTQRPGPVVDGSLAAPSTDRFSWLTFDVASAMPENWQSSSRRSPAGTG